MKLSQYYYGRSSNNKSDNYRNMESLSADIRKSWQADCDGTNSMKEISQIINGILVMSSIEEYFSNNKEDLEFFMGEFSDNVIELILMQPVIYGDNGDDIALDLLFNYVKLFMRFHKNKDYSTLFENIRKIFSLQNHYYIKQNSHYKKDINPKKGNTYEQFNEEFCKFFKKDDVNNKNFNVGDKVDVLIKNIGHNSTLDYKAWARGYVSNIIENQYIIDYPGKFQYNSNTITYSFGDPNVLKEGTKTEDWEWRLSLKENDVIDCYNRGRWYPATIIKVNEYKNNNGLIYKEYKVGFRLYPDNFMNNDKYEYSTYIQCTIFWDNNDNVDKDGRTFYGDSESDDEDIAFNSKRIQKFQSFSSIQREVLNNQMNRLMNSYNNSPKFGTRNVISFPTNINSDCEDRIRMMTELLKNDEAEKIIIEDLYFYEKDNQINYIIGKDPENFSYYYAKLLKLIADKGYFEEMINILKDKPSVDEVSNIFYILMNSASYVHKEYFKRNYELFKEAYINMMDNLTSKEIKTIQKEIIELSTGFFLKINYTISNNKTMKTEIMNDINLVLNLKMIKSSKFDKVIQGLKFIGDYIKTLSDDDKAKKNLIDLIKKYNIIKIIFGTNYHAQIISKSNEILEFMLKNDELTEEDLGLIWSLTKKGDVEAEKNIIQLLSNLIIYLKENYCNILLKYLDEEEDKNSNENRIDLIYNLAIKTNNEKYLIKCCEIYSNNTFEIKNLNNLSKSPYISKILYLIAKNENYCKAAFDIFEKNIKKSNNILVFFFLLDKIIEKYKNHIDINSDNSNDFINNEIHSLIDNDRLLFFFKENFLSYKNIAKENLKNNNIIKVDGYTHEENMKNRISFLIKTISFLYPKFDFFGLLKEICINEPVLPTDKSIFYKCMKQFLSKDNESKESKEQKISIETQIFNMLTEDNKTEMTLDQFNLFVEIFLDINKEKDILRYGKIKDDEYVINIQGNLNIADIFGIDNIWNLLFELKNEEFTKKLTDILFNLYKNKNEINKLLDKCVNIIKDTESITFNKLEKCIYILKYLIEDSERKGYIQVKSHDELSKNVLYNIPLDLKKNYKNINDGIPQFVFGYKANDNEKYNSIDLLYGNTSIFELKQIVAEKHNIDVKNIYVYLVPLENNSKNNINNHNNNGKILDSSYDNKSLKQILTIESNNKKNKNILANKLVFKGDKIEKEPFIKNRTINQKYKKMISEWFYQFTHGDEIFEKENIIKFISFMNDKKNVDENDHDYIQFMKYDEGEKGIILEEEFLSYYIELAQTEPQIVRQQMKKMKYRDDFKKSTYISETEFIDQFTLPRYILGNDKKFYESMIQLFQKFEKKSDIKKFLFFLCTNENEYNELLDNYEIFFNNSNNLEQLYQLTIIESFLQDLEVKYLDLKKIFKDNNKTDVQDENCNYEIYSRGYFPFDDEKNFNKKKLFLVNFIEKKGYEKLIKYIENIFDDMINNNIDNEDEKNIKSNCINDGLIIINMIYNSFEEKRPFKQNKNKSDLYYLYTINNNINIKKLLDIEGNIINNDNNDTDNNNKNIYNKLEEIVLNTTYLNLIKKITSFLMKTQNKTIFSRCFTTLINLMTYNEKLSAEVKNNDEIKQNISELIKSNINSQPNKEENKLFIKSLINHINTISKNKKDFDKLDFDFLYFIFEISYLLFKKLMNSNNENNDKDKNSNNSIFFEFFSCLIKVILNPDNINFLNTNINNEFIFQIYELLYKNLKEESQSKKLSEDSFLGFMKILMTLMKGDQLLKNKILKYKINDETIFDIIYNIIMKETNNKNRSKNTSDDDLEIENLISNIENTAQSNKFIPIDKCNEIRDIFNNVNQNKDELFISQKIYDIFNEFILICLRGSTEPEYITKLLKIIAFQNNKNYSPYNKDKKVKKRKAYGYVGLKNIGCICYMNSILQQMYMVPSFRYAIMSSDDEKSQNIHTSFINNNIYDDNLLHQLQKMYTFLTYSEKEAYNPKDFCASFKDFDNAPINPIVQQDSQEFFNNFCDKIENCLKSTKYKYIIDNIFTGKTCSSVICEKCKTVSNRFEDFYNLTLEVKNIGSLYESLQKLVDPERIEQFKCEECQQKVTISKRTSLAKLPNVLFVHLKRFYMDYELERTEKINSKFEFPNTLDLKNFCIEELSKTNNEESYDKDDIYPKEDEYYQYELKGINIHIGNAQGGHYISFIDAERNGHNNEQDIKASIEDGVIKSKWLKFNDSIICQFDTKDIPIESFGGSIDNTFGNENENVQSAYLLIYERIKKTPIKIIINKDNIKESNNGNNIISFKEENKKNVDKFYDISYSNKNKCVKEEELYNLIFYNEDINEYYSFVPYYNIEKKILKDNFIEVMNKNKKIFSNKIVLQENSKFKDDCNDILYSAIHSKDFNIANKNFTLNDKKSLISFFQEQIFDNKIFRNIHLIDDEESKLILNDRTTILLENIILPIINLKDIDKEEYRHLIKCITNIFLINNNLEKIFQILSSKKLFDIKNVKIMSDIIYSLLHFYNNENENIGKYLNKLYKLINEIGYPLNIFGENNEDKEQKTTYLLELLYKVLQLNTDLVEFSINNEKISDLLTKISSIKNHNLRMVIYNIINLLIDSCKFYQNDKGSNTIDSNEREKILDNISKGKKLLKRLFTEKFDILIKLIKILEYNDKASSEKLNHFTVGYLCNYAIKEKSLDKMMDLLYEIINIKDNYILYRLYIIMGFPEMLVKQQIKEEKNENIMDIDSDDDDDESKQNLMRELGKEEEDNNNKDFFPLFGNNLLQKSENGEIFKYTNDIKLYETHCILAQLFPCTNDEFYINREFTEKEEYLDEKERIKYMYKLLTIALLEEGNYCLFKYIYLTPSRFIAKYSNLYEEIIDILKKEKSYNLTEIIQNAEMCIKRVNFETNRINDSLSLISNKNIDANDDNEENITNENKVEEENKNDFKEPSPALPEKMMKTYKENETIEEFTGFIPRNIPDSIQKVVYSGLGNRNDIILLCVKYYTSLKSVESLRKEEEQKAEKKEINEDKEKEKEKEKQEENKINDTENKNKNDEEVSELNRNNIPLIVNHESTDSQFISGDIKICEKLFLGKTLSQMINNKIKIVIHNEFFDNKQSPKLSLVRFILVSLSNYNNIVRINIQDANQSDLIKYNFYAPNFIMSCIKSNNYTDIFSVYRKNKVLDFINKNSFRFGLNSKKIHYIANENYFTFSGWDDDSD